MRAVVVIAATLFAVSSAAPVAAQAAPFCAAGQQPDFVLGFANLRQRLGATMGVPVECEHTDPASGDATQQTSTGLAYFSHDSGLVAFTNGFEHYALMGDDELLLWRSASVDPPEPTPDERAYLNATAALRGRVDQLDEDLTAILQQGQAGNLVDVDFATLGADIDELRLLRDEFTATPAPARLSAFASAWLQAQEADLNAGQALLQARLNTEPSGAQAEDLSAAAIELERRDQLRSSAVFSYTEVLPVVVQ